MQRQSVTYLVKGFINLQMSRLISATLQPSLTEYAMFIPLLAGQVFVLLSLSGTM